MCKASGGVGVWDASGRRGGVTGEKLHCVLVQKVFTFLFFLRINHLFQGLFFKRSRNPFFQKFILHMQII